MKKKDHELVFIFIFIFFHNRITVELPVFERENLKLRKENKLGPVFAWSLLP